MGSSQESQVFSPSRSLSSSIFNSNSPAFAARHNNVRFSHTTPYSSLLSRLPSFPMARTLTVASQVKGVKGKCLISYEIEEKQNTETKELFKTTSIVLLDADGHSVTVSLAITTMHFVCVCILYTIVKCTHPLIYCRLKLRVMMLFNVFKVLNLEKLLQLIKVT